MSALRLEVETHIVTASATAVQNLTKCVAAAGRQDRRARRRLAGLGRGRPDRDREGARRRGRRHRRRARSTSPCSRTARRSTPGSCRSVAPTSPTTSRSGSRRASRSPRSSRSSTARATCAGIAEDEQISVSVLGEEAGRTVSRLEVCQIIEARMRETFELLRNEIRAAGVGMLPAGMILTGGASQLAGAAELGREVLQMPVRVAAPSGIGGLVDTLLNPGYSTARRACSSGAPRALADGRARALRIGAGDGRPRPAPGRAPEHLPVGRPGGAATHRRGAPEAPETAIEDAPETGPALYSDRSTDLPSTGNAREDPARQHRSSPAAGPEGEADAAAFRFRELRSYPGHRRWWRRQQRRQPDDPGRDDGRRVHRLQHRRPGPPPGRRTAQDPDRRQDHPGSWCGR